MSKLIRESLNEFERSDNALTNLGIGLFKPNSGKETIMI
jgi:hypothetical protein